MNALVRLYSDEEGEISSFLSRFFQNKEIAIEDELLWQKEYANPLEMVDMMGALIENQEDYKINMWISLDEGAFLNVSNDNADSIIRYLYERDPYQFSSSIVTGPSFVKDTFISAPKTPCSVCIPSSLDVFIKYSYSLFACSGFPALLKLGLFPFEQSAYKVN